MIREECVIHYNERFLGRELTESQFGGGFGTNDTVLKVAREV
jgi:hypothetical protein